MIEKWITRIASRFKTFFAQAKIFRIKSNLITSVGIYFICILLTQLCYGFINLEYARQSSENRDVQTVSNYINQAALNIKLELDRIDKMSRMVYDESYFYFKEKDNYSKYQSDSNELNTIIDMIFKITRTFRAFRFTGRKAE
jgi:hypothetical protein